MSTRLAALGPRICIMGPSNSGKSTLALAIAARCGLRPVHMDQLYHLPGTDWAQRPQSEFLALHEAAIAGERWVIDGNYSICLEQRLARATGVILLDSATMVSLWRYLRRTCFEKQGRAGALEGGRDSVKWDMIHHIGFATRANRRRYARLFEHLVLPKIILDTARVIEDFYRDEELSREFLGGRRFQG